MNFCTVVLDGLSIRAEATAETTLGEAEVEIENRGTPTNADLLFKFKIPETHLSAGEIFKTMYPVGSLYFSVGVDPNTISGVWEKIPNKRYLISSGQGVNAGTTGGSNSHSHLLDDGFAKIITSNDISTTFFGTQFESKNTPEWTGTQGFVSTSSRETHTMNKGVALGGSTSQEEFLPSYYAVDVWRRTA